MHVWKMITILGKVSISYLKSTNTQNLITIPKLSENIHLISETATTRGCHLVYTDTLKWTKIVVKHQSKI